MSPLESVDALLRWLVDERDAPGCWTQREMAHTIGSVRARLLCVRNDLRHPLPDANAAGDADVVERGRLYQDGWEAGRRFVVGDGCDCGPFVSHWPTCALSRRLAESNARIEAEVPHARE